MSTIVTSDYTGLSVGAIKGRLGRRSAADRAAGIDGPRGRARMSIEIEATPIVHQFDDLMLGKEPAAAIAAALTKAVKGIRAEVSTATKYTRTRQEIAYAAGKPWAVRRFGFRKNARPPHSGNATMFNHSGTFADSIVATENRTDKSWTVNVAAIRLDPRTSQNPAQFAAITQTLIRLVPEFGDPTKLAHHPDVQAAITRSLEDMITSAEKLGNRLRAERLRAALDAFGLGGIGRLHGKVSVVFGD